MNDFLQLIKSALESIDLTVRVEADKDGECLVTVIPLFVFEKEEPKEESPKCPSILLKVDHDPGKWTQWVAYASFGFLTHSYQVATLLPLLDLNFIQRTGFFAVDEDDGELSLITPLHPQEGMEQTQLISFLFGNLSSAYHQLKKRGIEWQPHVIAWTDNYDTDDANAPSP